MQPVKIYTKMLCPYCYRAKALLNAKEAAFEEIDITMNPSMRQEMVQSSNGRTTVPQIFIGETHVGGYDEMAALDAAGKLDPLLAGAV